VFSCQQSGKSDGIWIRTGTVVANQFPSPSDHSSGRAQVSSRSDRQKTKTWIADRSASGATIVDQYLTEGLSIGSLKSDRSALFAKR
jgi:hypothetical protein